MKIRAAALSRFGEKNIRPGAPMAMLEDALVPLYLYHRYQLEAVTKWIGGVDYTYALRGDGQMTSKLVPKADQLRALDAILRCMEPSALALPAKIQDMIPPRPAGYEFTRELFKKRTGLLFDALSPAETAADIPFSFLFDSERLSRLAQQEVNGGLGITEMVNRIMKATWKAPRKTGTEKLIQQQTEQVLLTYLLAASVDEKASYAARAAVLSSLETLKKDILSWQKTSTDPAHTGHLALALERMKSPEKAKPIQHLQTPPGAPIGCWED
jgi:hypothetical protein